MDVQQNQILQSDFWLKISGVPQELIRSVFASMYNATPTIARIPINGILTDMPILERLPTNIKICANSNCVNFNRPIEDRADACQKCEICGSALPWRDWKPPFTILGVNSVLSIFLQYVNSNITTGNVKFSEIMRKKGITEDQFFREWSSIIANTFIEDLYVEKSKFMTNKNERLTGPQVSKIWQVIATNIYSAMSKGNNAKLVDSSTESRSISESKMQVSTQKAEEEEGPIKSVWNKMSSGF